MDLFFTSLMHLFPELHENKKKKASCPEGVQEIIDSNKVIEL